MDMNLVQCKSIQRKYAGRNILFYLNVIAPAFTSVTTIRLKMLEKYKIQNVSLLLYESNHSLFVTYLIAFSIFIDQ